MHSVALAGQPVHGSTKQMVFVTFGTGATQQVGTQQAEPAVAVVLKVAESSRVIEAVTIQRTV